MSPHTLNSKSTRVLMAAFLGFPGFRNSFVPGPQKNWDFVAGDIL